MSDANRTAVRVSKETSFKTPFATPLFQPIRITSVGLAYTPETVTSNELDPTRQIVDQPLVGFSAGGDIPAELSIGNFDICMDGLFMNPWIRSPEVQNGASWKYGSGSVAMTRFTALAATSLTFAANAVLAGSQINSPATAFVAGHLIYISGLGAGNPDQILRASASTGTSVTVAGATPVASPPASARVKVIGFEGIAGDIAAVTVGGPALTSTALNFTTLGLSVGQYIWLGTGTFGFAAFSGPARISAIAAGRLSFDNVPTGFVADAGATKTIRGYFTDCIKNGVVEDISYYIEEEFGLTAGTRYMYHRGQEVNSRVISAETKAIITDTWNFLGADATPVATSRQTGAVSLAPSIGSVLNSSTSVPVMYENGVPVVGPNFVNSFSITIENAKRTRDAVAVMGAADIGTGRLGVTGTMNTYFGSEVYYNKVISNEITSLAFGFGDQAAMRSEIYDMPKVKYSGGTPDVTGIDTDIMVALEFRALRDIEHDRDYTLMLSRFEYRI
jgi:hypothetical protein